MDGFLLKLLAFIVAIGILVTVHEFGHFWVARRLGVKVLRFSIGFGRPLKTWRGRRDDTEYVIAAIPLGGYVRMLDGREDEVPPDEAHRAFDRKPLWVRSAVVLAGPLFNFLFAIVAFWAILVLGEIGARPLIGDVLPGTPAAQAGLVSGEEIVAVAGERTPTWGQVLQALAGSTLSDKPLHLRGRLPSGEEREHRLPAGTVGDPASQPDLLQTLGIRPDRPVVPPVFGEVLPGEAAAQAGIHPGDRILDADGQTIDDWGDWVRYVQARPGQPIHLRIERAGRELALTVIPARRQQGDREIGRIGAVNQPLDEAVLSRWRVEYRLGPLEALPEAAGRTLQYSVLTLKVIWRILTGEASIQNLSGPLSIADAAGKTASHGLVSFLRFLAIVSISLGVINLLPVPVLDGGHLLYFLIEAVRGGPLPERWLEYGQRIGIAMLVALMFVAFYVDIVRLFG
ncbi:RIP metalloprotease RseP [endosymbiont of unidentified scaly snail isolate Monju]|uniref:RIP metalloprotease RseP n=1 Tax=endosymbiont of unidentified scaly snail isolate Monju TaxID=1248727 RepID=UPI0003892D96|nr:RIP metalloprotease RseP [endosymbiont of unidentified scaly snail isolate Monju]BAN68671.1 regulator of sigma E protease [endosymbiont of unidentified scaly snail isolate Monju]